MTPDDAHDLGLGDPVKFTWHLRRTSTSTVEKDRSGRYDIRVFRKVWLPSRRTAGAIVVGRRHLADGVVEHDSEYGSSFTPERRFLALLVVTDMRHRPVLVLPEHLERRAPDPDPLPVPPAPPEDPTFDISVSRL